LFFSFLRQGKFHQICEGAAMGFSSLSPLLANRVTKLLLKQVTLNTATVRYAEMLENLQCLT
jgi:hypothetical protein